MKTQGVKVLDPVLETNQLQWLVVPARECPDNESERRVIARYFRVPHEPWGPEKAFVGPVEIRRSRHRVLFCQELGILE